MVKLKYKFNPESLSYDKIEHSIKTKILKGLPPVFFSFSLAFIAYYFAFEYVFNSPKEKRLISENQNMRLNYELLNKKLDNINEVLKDVQYRDDNLYRVIFEAEPIPNSIRNAGFGGINRYEKLEGYDNSDLIIETSKKLDQITKKIVVQSKSYDEVVNLAKNKEKRLASIPAIQPVLNKELNKISSYYGVRYDPIYKGTKKFHHGIDFTAHIGTPIHVTGNGVVKSAENSRSGYGNAIEIDHGFGYTTFYAHLNSFKVKKGQKVTRGEIIGTIGSTGKSTGPHLHYEVRKNKKSQDPINYFYMDLSPAEYDRMIELSSQEGGLTLD